MSSAFDSKKWVIRLRLLLRSNFYSRQMIGIRYSHICFSRIYNFELSYEWNYIIKSIYHSAWIVWKGQNQSYFPKNTLMWVTSLPSYLRMFCLHRVKYVSLHLFWGNVFNLSLMFSLDLVRSKISGPDASVISFKLDRYLISKY